MVDEYALKLIEFGLALLIFLAVSLHLLFSIF
jgi:hypothetical protein